MKGSAPKSPATGSQVEVCQKPKPNFWIDSHDSLTSTAPMPTTMATTSTANAPVLTRKPRSPWFPRRTARVGVASGDTNFGERGQLHLHDFGRQRRVTQLRRELLPVAERPLHELDHRLALGLVLRVLVEQEPREGRDRVDALAL